MGFLAKKIETDKKSNLRLVEEDPRQLSFDFSEIPQNRPQLKQASEDSNEVAVVVYLHPEAQPQDTLDFEGLPNEEDILAERLFEKFRRFKVMESTSGKFSKSSVASAFINDQTVEEFIPWAIMKGIEKWRQHKMIKEYEKLTSPMGDNVKELYHAKLQREQRIRHIAEYFETSVDKQSSLMVFTEFNQIWNYCYTTFNSKIRNTYRDSVKTKSNDEYIDYYKVEDCLELNPDFSEHFAQNDNKHKSSRDVYKILCQRVAQINPAKSEIYKKVFIAHFIEGRDMVETVRVLDIPRNVAVKAKRDLVRMIDQLREDYRDYIEAA